MRTYHTVKPVKAMKPRPPTTQPTTRGQLNFFLVTVPLSVLFPLGVLLVLFIGGLTLSLNEFVPNYMIPPEPLDLPIK